MKNYHKLFFIIIPVFIYLIFIIFIDSQKIMENLLTLKVEYYLIFIGFWSLGVLSRIIRWHIYMKKIEPKISFMRNALYFLAGFSMLLSPGRIGEVITINKKRFWSIYFKNSFNCICREILWSASKYFNYINCINSCRYFKNNFDFTVINNSYYSNTIT